MDKKVSIITPSFNRAYIIDETAQSIFRQKYTNWEWVIVDDGSTDNSWELLQKYAAEDSRVRVFQRDREPKGACVCRNIAVEKCTGDYLIFLDTDDLLASFCLEQRVKAMQEDKDCDFIIFPMLLFKKKPDDLRLLWNIETDEDDLLRILKGDPICQGTGTLWKKSSFQKIGMWKEDLKLWQDIELHIRGLLWPMKYAKRMELNPDIFLRVSDDSLSREGYFSEPKMKSRISVYVDACNKIIEQGLKDKYIDGLRAMGVDVITSAVKSNLYKEAREIIRFCKKNGVINKNEASVLNKFNIANKIKIYKFPFFYKLFVERNTKLVVNNIGTLSSVGYAQEIISL